jgi:hypothetical protein
MGWDNEQRHVTDYVSPLGTWIRLGHRVVRAGGTTFDVPLGTFRVDRIAVDELGGTVDIEASDAGALVADYDLPLAAGQVLTTTNYGDAAAAMVNAVLTGIPPWWTQGGVSTAGVPAVKPATRLQYVGSRVDAATELAKGAATLIVTPINDSYAFRLVAPTSPKTPAVITIRPGALGNMVSHLHTYDREGLANVALMSYTVQTKSGTQTVTTQRRLQIEYTQAGADIRAGGPFGRVTMDVDATNITTDAQASTAAQAALKARLSNTSDIALNVSPIYGLEPGDPVKVERADGTATPGQVVGATIGLTANDPWTVTVRSFLALPAGAFSRPTVITAPAGAAHRGQTQSDLRGIEQTGPRDATSWYDFPATTTDLTGNTANGWTVSAGTVQDGGSRLALSASGSFAYVRLLSSGTFDLATAHKRVRVQASVFAADQDIDVRTLVNGTVAGVQPGVWQRITANASGLVIVELADVTGLFAVGVDVSNPGDASVTPGLIAYVSNVVVQWAELSP